MPAAGPTFLPAAVAPRIAREDVVWSLVAALHAIVPGFGVLFALRLALGVAESPSFPAGAQIVQRVLPAADRPRGMSTLFIGMSVGGMIAPPIAIGLATHTSWRLAFVGTAAVAALWLPLWLFVTRDPAARAALDAHVGPLDGRPDPVGELTRR